MAIHWGVDSVNSANGMVPVPDEYLNGGPPAHLETVFAYVVRRMQPLLANSGRPEQPVFWGRYINGRYRLSRDKVIVFGAGAVVAVRRLLLRLRSS